MTELEDLLREAYHRAADTIARDDIPPAPHAPTGRSRPGLLAGKFRLARPMLAAVAVLLVAAATLVPRFLTHTGGAPPSNGRNTGLLHIAHPGQPPRFFAALPGSGLSIQFFGTSTGHLTGQVAPPSRRDIFTGVVAEPDDRTFIVAVERGNIRGGCLAHLFRVRLTNAGLPGMLRPMSDGPIQGILPAPAMALSPDGSTLAYFAWNCQGRGNLVVKNLASGSTTTWTGRSAEEPEDLSLSANGTVVSWSGTEFKGYVHDTTLPGSAIRLKPVTAILRATGRQAQLDTASAIVLHTAAQQALSPDGSTLFACTVQPTKDVLSAYDVASRHQLAVLASWPRASGTCSLAMAPDGAHILLGKVRGHVAIFNTTTGHITSSPAAGLSGNAAIVW